MLTRARARLRALSDQEQGYTLTELLVAMSIGIVAVIGIYTIIDITARGSQEITGEVEASQRARPAMAQVMDRLHSSCVASEVPPVQSGSDGSTLKLLHQTGDDAVVTPDLRVISLAGGNLTETVYPATGGSAPSWTFSTTAGSNYQILDEVETGASGLFTYYAYVSGTGVIDDTPLTTPLSVADAARTVQVSVAFSVDSKTTGEQDRDRTRIDISDSAVLRFSAAESDPAEENLPCV